MKNNIKNIKTIKNIFAKSPAKKAGLKKGYKVVSINNEPIVDFIDDNYFNSLEDLKVNFVNSKGIEKSAIIKKDAETPLGIEWVENLYPPDNSCTNKCVFCFVDQLPKGMRETMYVKDDDWIYSIAFGNYVTLTNVSDEEFQRIIKRKASPLYLSVHAIDAEVRLHLMKNPNAKKIKEQIDLLTSNGIVLHTQIVLCPGLNDGEVLNETIEYLANLYPMVRSLAVVPVGLTKHRKNLTQLELVNKNKAREIIQTIKDYNKKYMKKFNNEFVFASDEFYKNADMPFPIYENGNHMLQLNNGVGMFSELVSEFEDALKIYEDDISKIDSNLKFTSITGTSSYNQIKKMIDVLVAKTKNLNFNVVKGENRLFGDTITVTGLLCGNDIYETLKDTQSNVIIVPGNTLKSGENKFLDDMTTQELGEKLNAQVVVQDVDGYAMIETIINHIGKEN